MKGIAFVIFGITSNLSKTKLLPALFDIYKSGVLADDISFLGVARQSRNDEELRNLINGAISGSESEKRSFVSKFEFLNGDLQDQKFYVVLSDKLDKKKDKNNRVLYLATHPALYGDIFNNLNSVGLNRNDTGWTRLMIEKPIGSDLVSAKKLNNLLLKYFNEEQIFRIDHYLGKETVQNILAFRFNNPIVEETINGTNIDHIQLTVAENFGSENRDAYYDQVGALKDVGQNHALQMLAIATMCRPDNFDNEGITKKRLEVLENFVPDKNSIVLGQYNGYSADEKKTTNTFFAFKGVLGHGGFKGVPVYVRGGKKLKKTVAEIVVVLKNSQNFMVYRIQPNEGIIMNVLVKTPGQGMKLQSSMMEFCFKNVSSQLAKPYEKLVLDAIGGDQTYFNDVREVEAQWKFIDVFCVDKITPIEYQENTWGPKKADDLIEKDGRKWIEPSEVYCKV